MHTIKSKASMGLKYDFEELIAYKRRAYSLQFSELIVRYFYILQLDLEGLVFGLTILD